MEEKGRKGGNEDKSEVFKGVKEAMKERTGEETFIDIWIQSKREGGNEAIECVLNQRLRYTSGAQWLGETVLQDRWVIAVAGTHGKTTTASMVAWILDYAGLSPGFLIGGAPANFAASARLGEMPFFVVEADEYDTSYFDRRSKFVHYRPQTLIINNLEFDHADIYKSIDDILWDIDQALSKAAA